MPAVAAAHHVSRLGLAKRQAATGAHGGVREGPALRESAGPNAEKSMEGQPAGFGPIGIVFAIEAHSPPVEDDIAFKPRQQRDERTGKQVVRWSKASDGSFLRIKRRRLHGSVESRPHEEPMTVGFVGIDGRRLLRLVVERYMLSKQTHATRLAQVVQMRMDHRQRSRPAKEQDQCIMQIGLGTHHALPQTNASR
ncbi:hypothetical protein K2D_43020 [Planctomycetes bacterium K2D]|nr:hypothetical protein K2D_43020 [Planctomycetes bacterium K2D]